MFYVQLNRHIIPERNVITVLHENICCYLHSFRLSVHVTEETYLHIAHAHLISLISFTFVAVVDVLQLSK
jgi:hypothetical protein